MKNMGDIRSFIKTYLLTEISAHLLINWSIIVRNNM